MTDTTDTTILNGSGNNNGSSNVGTTDLPVPPKILVRSMSVATGVDVMGYANPSANTNANANINGYSADTNANTNNTANAASSPVHSSPSASSDRSMTSYDSTPSVTAIERALSDAPGVTTDRSEFLSTTSTDDSNVLVASASHSDTTDPTAPPRSLPVLERSYTASELLTRRQKEFQSARGANDKPLFATTGPSASSASSTLAPSFEIESVVLPSDAITEIEIDKAMHTLFAVEVRLHGGLQWIIKKRYSDFRELHDRLKRTNASVKSLHFPKRHVFRNRHQSVIEQRRSELEKYINDALEIRPLIRVPLFNFLEVYVHMESYERKVQRHKKELESERMKNLLEPGLLEDLSSAFKRLCSSKFLYHGSATTATMTAATTAATTAPTSSSTATTNGGDKKDETGSVASSASFSSSTATGTTATTTTTATAATVNGNGSSVATSPKKEPTSTAATSPEKTTVTVAAVPQTAGAQIYLSRTSFRRDVLGVFPDMPSSFAMRFMKAVSDRQGADINMDEFLRAIAVLERGTLDDKLRFVFNMCDLDHAGKVQSTGLSNFLVSLHGRHVLDLPEYRRVFTEGFDHGRVRMTVDEFVAIMPRLEVVDDLLIGWMAPFVEVLCETPDPQLLESQEEFNPVVQQKILATDTQFTVKEVSMLQDAFNNYRASGGGDAVDMDALASDFPLEMTDERFQRVFASFGQRANGLDIDIFSFVHALAIACRGTTQEKASFAFKLFATAGKDNCLMTRDDLYGMMRLDLSQNPELERLVTAFMERYKKKHANAKLLKTTDSALSESGAQTPSVSGSQLGRFVDALMAEYGHKRPISSIENADVVLALTPDEFLAWTTREKYEMASLRIMREVVFVDLGLVPSSKDEELAIVKGCYKSFDPASLVEDEAWFLIEKKWFDHWCKYIGLTLTDSLANSTTSSSTSLSDLSSKIASATSSKSTAPSSSTAKADAALLDADGNYVRPKPINNYPILTNDRREHILKTSDEIKLGKHYAIVPEQLWMGLKVWYGGGPEIRRKVVIKSDGTTILDIWEEVLKKKKKTTKSGSEEDDDDDSPDLTSEEEKNKRTKALALPRRMRTGGSVGLTNLGNTCYMNSALQCLTNTQLLAEYFLSGMYLDDVNRTSTLGLQGKLAEVYGKLAEDMWCAKQKALSPRNFKKTIGKFNEAFRGSDQQDAQELLAFLLSGLSEDLNRIHDKPYVEQPDSDGRFDGDLADEWWRNHLRREVSIIVALFTGQYKSLLTCSECGFKSARFEPFTFLQLPLPEPTHNTVTLALVLSNGMAPMKVSVRLGISATILELKQELVKLCQTDFDLPNITEADIKVCEYTGSMILSFKADSRRIGQIRSIERLIAFQLEPLDQETIQLTRNRRPSYVPAASAALRIEELEAERQAHTKFLDNLTKGTLVEVKPRSQSHEYIPGVIVECPSIAEEAEEEETEPMPLYRIRLQRLDEDMKVPAACLRPRQARLLYIPLLSRKLSYSALYFKNPFRPAPFGIPNLVRICPELTSGFDLYKLVWQRVKRYVDHGAPPHKWSPEEAPEDVTVSNRIETIFTGLTSSCGFVLRRVESKGLTDSRSMWLTRSFGQIIPCTDELISIMEEETIAIDWDLEIFQDRVNLEKMKHIESHASVEKNDAIDKGPVPLRHCLDAFTSEEKISEGYCSSCRKHLEMTKKLEIWRLPPVMVVHLKRFQYTQTYRRKLASLVEFPVHGLDLNTCVAPHVDQPERYPCKRKDGAPIEKIQKETPAAVKTVANEVELPSNEAKSPLGGAASSSSGGDKNEGDKAKEDKDTVADLDDTVKTRASSKSGGGPGPTMTRVRRGYTNTNLDQSRCLETQYDLYGVVNHQGALGGGHYTAHAKNFLDDQWYYYDDERVRVVEESKVVSPSAYLLFYVRSDMKGTLVKDLYPQNSNKKITDEDINRFVEDDRRCHIM